MSSPPTTEEIAERIERGGGDALLRPCHQALAMNNPQLLAVSFATLDKYLSQGGTLPRRWAQAVHPVIESDGVRIAHTKTFEPTTEVTDAGVTVVDKRGRK